MNSGENPRCTEGKTPRHCSAMQMTALRVGSGLISRSSTACHAGDQVFGGQKPSRIDAEGGERQRIFLHGVALVFKQHHHHGDAQQHLRQRAEHVPGVSENLGVRTDELSDRHQAAPERKGESEHAERERIAAVREEVKAMEQYSSKAAMPISRRTCGSVWRSSRKTPFTRWVRRLQHGQTDAAHGKSDVVPAQAEALAHQSGRDEKAQRHYDDQ